MYRLTVRASKDSVAQTLSDLLQSQLWRRRVSLSQQSLASSHRRSGFFNASHWQTHTVSEVGIVPQQLPIVETVPQRKIRGVEMFAAGTVTTGGYYLRKMW